MKDICYLVNTGDRTQWVWKYWYHYFKKYWNLQDKLDVVFLSENIPVDFKGVISETTGDGKWGEQLLRYLNRCPYDKIILVHDDHFNEEQPLPHILDALLRVFDDHKMNLLKCCGWWAGCDQWQEADAFIDTGLKIPNLNNESIWIYNNNKRYLVSHQPSIWRKDFLISAIKPEYNPWESEIYGTEELRKRNPIIHAYRGKMPIPIGEMVVHGQVRENMQKFFDDADREMGKVA